MKVEVEESVHAEDWSGVEWMEWSEAKSSGLAAVVDVEASSS